MNPKTILVVDDNQIIVRTLSFKLKSAGYQVVAALDGSAAVSAVRKEKPDLILLDIGFPPDVAFGFGGGVQWDGFLIIEWLRRMEEAKRTPIIIITGGDAAKYKERSLAAGAVAFFHKPIDHDELLVVIRKTLAESAGAGPPAPDAASQV
jgi:CheY-like chemotaxis protein